MRQHIHADHHVGQDVAQRPLPLDRIGVRLQIHIGGNGDLGIVDRQPAQHQVRKSVCAGLDDHAGIGHVAGFQVGGFQTEMLLREFRIQESVICAGIQLGQDGQAVQRHRHQHNGLIGVGRHFRNGAGVPIDARAHAFFRREIVQHVMGEIQINIIGEHKVGAQRAIEMRIRAIGIGRDMQGCATGAQVAPGKSFDGGGIFGIAPAQIRDMENKAAADGQAKPRCGGMPQPGGVAAGTSLLLGLRELSMFHVYIAYRAKELYLTPRPSDRDAVAGK